MLEIQEIAPGIFRLVLGIPERHLIHRIATAYSFNDTTALTAVMNRGIDSISKQVQNTDKPDEPTDNSDQGKLWDK